MAHKCILSLCAVIFTCAASPAFAHFPWLVIANDGKTVEVYFSEDATVNDADLLDYVAKAKLWQIDGEEANKLSTEREDEALTAKLKLHGEPPVVVLQHKLGVVERQGAKFLLNYYAKSGPTLGSQAWENPACRKVVDMDIVPKLDGKQVRLTVLWQDKPVAKAQVVVVGPGTDVETKTDEKGIATFAMGRPGVYSIRARHIEERAGTADGKDFDSVRHYATLALPIGEKADSPAPPAENSGAKRYPALPIALTSFGAAVAGDRVYAYGGHTGEAHSYSNSEQSNELIQLDLKKPKQWKTVARGPSLQSLALVNADGKLYRMGGFTAKNDAGDEHDLWSQTEVASFDLQTQKWQDGPPLPEPRSSFDAAVIDGVIYVVGGWQLRGDEENIWHKTAWRLDPAAEKPTWEPVPQPPFQRRALALAEYEGRLYALGGMQPKGGPTTRVVVFDPQSSKWTRGPELPGEPMEGFGCSAFAARGRLYVSTVGGNLLRLAKDGKSWEQIQKLDTARFFHRMLPINNGSLLMLGGANMEIGKFQHIDVVELK